MSLDPLPPFNRTALLLDLDGTLLDIAPTPDSVVVEDGLVDTLTTLRGRLDDALAIITGRPIETIDALLDRAPWAVAGEHGGAIRRRPDGTTERPDMPPPPHAWIETAERLRDAHPGAILEVKARGFALHFRQAPSAGTVFEAAMRAMVADTPDFQLLAGHMLWEIRPRGADKGVAVAALLEHAPFAGRLPLFIGDDVTDEDGMKVARAVGGAGLRVDAAFGTPSGVRNWLRAAAALGDWPELPHANG
jgi:trehalose 6-phosphate phosphatase